MSRDSYFKLVSKCQKNDSMKNAIFLRTSAECRIKRRNHVFLLKADVSAEVVGTVDLNWEMDAELSANISSYSQPI